MPNINSAPLFSIIIPVYNEENRIVPTLNEVFHFLKNRNIPAEVIIINDGSNDSTVEIIKKTFPAVVNLFIHSLPVNMGKGFAIKTGIEKSIGQVILFMDADSSTPITEFSKLEPYLKTYDIVIGSRIKDPAYERDSRKPWYRKVITYIGRKVIHYLIIKNINDTQCGFKLFRHDVAKELARRQTIHRFGFDVELLLEAQRLGYTIKEVPVQWQHSHGSRFHPFIDTIRTAWEIIKIKARRI
jgi:dolichyl-phosphate beta-glucosyltransferase